jgi:hypothetical protein
VRNRCHAFRGKGAARSPVLSLEAAVRKAVYEQGVGPHNRNRAFSGKCTKPWGGRTVEFFEAHLLLL